MQPHEHTLPIGHNDIAVAEEFAGMRFGVSGDSMRFKLELERNASSGHLDEKIGLEGSAFEKFVEGRASTQTLTKWHDAFAVAEHNDNALPGVSQPHIDGFNFFHL